MVSQEDVVLLFYTYTGGMFPRVVLVEDLPFAITQTIPQIPVTRIPQSENEYVVIGKHDFVKANANTTFNIIEEETGVWFLPHNASPLLQESVIKEIRDTSRVLMGRTSKEPAFMVGIKTQNHTFEEFINKHKIRSYAIKITTSLLDNSVIFHSLDETIMTGKIKIPGNETQKVQLQHEKNIIEALKKSGISMIVFPECDIAGNIFIHFFKDTILSRKYELSITHLLGLRELYAIRNDVTTIASLPLIHDTIYGLKQVLKVLPSLNLREHHLSRIIRILKMCENVIQKIPFNRQIHTTTYQGNFFLDTVFVANNKLYILDWSNFKTNFPPFFDIFDFLFMPNPANNENFIIEEVETLQKSNTFRRLFGEFTDDAIVSFAIYSVYTTNRILAHISKMKGDKGILTTLLFNLEKILLSAWELSSSY